MPYSFIVRESFYNCGMHIKLTGTSLSSPLKDILHPGYAILASIMLLWRICKWESYFTILSLILNNLNAFDLKRCRDFSSSSMSAVDTSWISSNLIQSSTICRYCQIAQSEGSVPKEDSISDPVVSLGPRTSYSPALNWDSHSPFLKLDWFTRMAHRIHGNTVLTFAVF